MQQCAGRSSVFGDGRVIRCSLVGFEWCALDGQESGVVPFGFEWCALDGQESGVVPFGRELVKLLLKNCLAKRLVDKMESGVDRERSSLPSG